MEDIQADILELDIDINENDKTNFRNISYSKRDVYYRRAKEEGFRARSVYKLKEINENFKILNNATKIIDLCAAPGSWSQMLRILTKDEKEAKIVSVDIQEIVPIEGVKIVKGDITKQETIENILSHFNKEKVDIVIFDGAPDVTGLLEIDMYMQVQLIIFSLVICLKVLKKEGKFVAKVFKEEGRSSRTKTSSDLEKSHLRNENSHNCLNDAINSDYYYEKVKTLFDNVYYFKPASSRNTSHETYIICEGFGCAEPEVETLIDSLNIEEIFNFREIKHAATREFIKFLCEGEY
jgi:tRNA (cytidine32/guanosine34-2'-O)-methyltransferase